MRTDGLFLGALPPYAVQYHTKETSFGGVRVCVWGGYPSARDTVSKYHRQRLEHFEIMNPTRDITIFINNIFRKMEK